MIAAPDAPFTQARQAALDWLQPSKTREDAERAWVEARKAELRAMQALGSRISYIYSTNQDLLRYGRTLGLNMIEVGGHRGHFHVGVKAWT